MTACYPPQALPGTLQRRRVGPTVSPVLLLPGEGPRAHIRKLAECIRWSYGAGIVLRLGNIARLELNYCIPMGVQRGDRCVGALLLTPGEGRAGCDICVRWWVPLEGLSCTPGRPELAAGAFLGTLWPWSFQAGPCPQRAPPRAFSQQQLSSQPGPCPPLVLLNKEVLKTVVPWSQMESGPWVPEGTDARVLSPVQPRL